MPRVRRKTGQVPGAIMGVLAFVCLMTMSGLGLLMAGVFIVIALCVEGSHWICGYCGNRIEKTSLMCPTCRCHLQ